MARVEGGSVRVGWPGAPGWTNGNGPTCSDPYHLSTAVYPNCPDADFQFHHQAFNYFASFAPGTQARKDHLKDEVERVALRIGEEPHAGAERGQRRRGP